MESRKDPPQLLINYEEGLQSTRNGYTDFHSCYLKKFVVYVVVLVTTPFHYTPSSTQSKKKKRMGKEEGNPGPCIIGIFSPPTNQIGI